MSFDGLLLTVITKNHRYIVRRDQMIELRLVTTEADLKRPDERGKPIISGELSLLLDPDDPPTHSRRHAIIVPTRRRSVALLVDRVEDVQATTEGMIQKLPEVFKRRLERPWFLGVMVQEDTPILVLDLRQVAQDMLFTQSSKKSSESIPAPAS
jgi:hypothetical protein